MKKNKDSVKDIVASKSQTFTRKPKNLQHKTRGNPQNPKIRWNNNSTKGKELSFGGKSYLESGGSFMKKHRFRRRSNKKLMMAKISTDENWRKKIRALLRFFSLFGEERSKEKNNIDLSHCLRLQLSQTQRSNFRFSFLFLYFLFN